MSDPIHDACMACLDRWMAALNRYDAAGMDAELHFPNVRFAEGKLHARPERWALGRAAAFQLRSLEGQREVPGLVPCYYLAGWG
ncbi:MAG: hypothetical protein WAO95_10670 [Burkholderiales bacterium]